MLPSTSSRARASTILAMTSSPAQTRAEDLKHRKYDATCAATGSHFSPFALETTGGPGASNATVYLLFAEQVRDSGLSADVLVESSRRTSRLRSAGARLPK